MAKSLIAKFHARPFPSNIEALRECHISYSQFGEDMFLTSLFGFHKTDGVYVDVGCFHPIRYSNTYIFYERGWRGIAIDPNAAWKDLWQRFRPRDTFVNCAVAEVAGTMPYLMNTRLPECNMLLDESAVPAVLNEDQVMTVVPTRPLHEILSEQLPEGDIDLLNVDCEGYDVEVLKTFDFSRRKPSIIAAEDVSLSLDTPLTALLTGHGYECKSHIGLTKVFQRS